MIESHQQLLLSIPNGRYQLSVNAAVSPDSAKCAPSAGFGVSVENEVLDVHCIGHGPDEIVKVLAEIWDEVPADHFLDVAGWEVSASGTWSISGPLLLAGECPDENAHLPADAGTYEFIVKGVREEISHGRRRESTESHHIIMWPVSPTGADRY